MSLSVLLEKFVDKKLRAIPQTLVCSVESFDKDTLRATVKPLYKSVDSKGNEIAYPLLSKIPVISSFFGKDISVIPSYKKGDLVLVVCSTFDFSKQLKKQSAKESEGLFGLENSFVIGGIKTDLDTTKDLQILFEDNKITFKNKNTKLEIKETHVTVTTQTGSFDVDTHKHIGNLGAPTNSPTPGS